MKSSFLMECSLRLRALFGDVAPMVDFSERLFEEGNYQESFKWCEMAAIKGSVRAMIGLATMHREGSGTSKDMAAAVRWLTIAASSDGDKKQDLDVRDAARQLAALYAGGEEVPKDEAKALALYQSLALGGCSMSMYELARLLQNKAVTGASGENERKEGRTWLLRAAAAGDPTASKADIVAFYCSIAHSKWGPVDGDLQKLERSMSSAELAEAKTFLSENPPPKRRAS